MVRLSLSKLHQPKTLNKQAPKSGAVFVCGPFCLTNTLAFTRKGFAFLTKGAVSLLVSDLAEIAPREPTLMFHRRKGKGPTTQFGCSFCCRVHLAASSLALRQSLRIRFAYAPLWCVYCVIRRVRPTNSKIPKFEYFSKFFCDIIKLGDFWYKAYGIMITGGYKNAT